MNEWTDDFQITFTIEIFDRKLSNVLPIFRFFDKNFASLLSYRFSILLNSWRIFCSIFVAVSDNNKLYTIHMNKRLRHSLSSKSLCGIKNTENLFYIVHQPSYTFLCLLFRHFIYSVIWSETIAWSMEMEMGLEIPRSQFYVISHTLLTVKKWARECVKERETNTRKHERLAFSGHKSLSEAAAWLFLAPKISHLTDKCVVCHQIARYKIYGRHIHIKIASGMNVCNSVSLFRLVWAIFVLTDQKQKLHEKYFDTFTNMAKCAISYVTFPVRQTCTVLIALAETKDPHQKGYRIKRCCAAIS